MGRKILHTGELGSASILKVITNYLASTHLVALGEAWTVAKKSNLDLAKTYKGIAISSGNSFVHETESQVILNGSYNCLLYTSPSPRDKRQSRMPSSA